MPTCDLGPLPQGVLPNVGFPEPGQVMVSKTDYAHMIAFVEALRDWAEDARACLAVRP